MLLVAFCAGMLFGVLVMSVLFMARGAGEARDSVA